MRNNIYKQKIINLLQKEHLLTIAEIHRLLPDADFSTLFRNVEQLLADKKIKKVIIDNKSVAYESSADSHDHFICNDCGGIESVQIPLGAQLKNKIVTDITIRGTCNNCVK